MYPHLRCGFEGDWCKLNKLGGSINEKNEGAKQKGKWKEKKKSNMEDIHARDEGSKIYFMYIF